MVCIDLATSIQLNYLPIWFSMKRVSSLHFVGDPSWRFRFHGKHLRGCVLVVNDIRYSYMNPSAVVC